MGPDRQVSCVLCQQSEETMVTGPLEIKGKVIAHQNCLLFSSGIFCRNSPTFDDLFGFSVEDVMAEVKRGSKLNCNGCKKKGATAGCEVKRCKKSFHYPCAIQKGAKIREDPVKGEYKLFCFKHHPESSKNSSSVVSKDPSGAGPSKRDTSDNSTQARPSVCDSDSNSSSSTMHLHSKRRLSFDHQQEENPLKRKSAARRRISDSSNSDENEPNTEIEIFAPLESDIDESLNSVSENKVLTMHQFTSLQRKDTESPTECTSGNHLEGEDRGRNKDEDETIIDSDAESESLLPVENGDTREATTDTALSPKIILVKTVESKREEEGSRSKQNTIHSPEPHIDGPFEHPPFPDPKPHSVIGSPQHSSSPITPGPVLGIDSSSFWKSCNVAGCTQAIFADFIKEMNNLANRIQSDQASQEDYDYALKVMVASGKLADLMAKQQTELKRKQMELTKAEAALKEVVSALRR